MQKALYDNKLSLNWMQIIITLLVLTATITMLFASVKVNSEQNTEEICELRAEQSDLFKLVYEIKVNLKQFMTQEGYKYMEVE